MSDLVTIRVAMEGLTETGWLVRAATCVVEVPRSWGTLDWRASGPAGRLVHEGRDHTLTMPRELARMKGLTS